MNKTKLIPFDIELAKAGAKVVTRIGKTVRVGFYDVKNEDYPILCLVEEDNGRELSWSYTKNGKYHKDEDIDSPYDLFIEEEEKEKPRREYSGTDSIYVPKDDEGIREELIDAINGLWDNDALPMPLSIKRKDAWLAWLEKQGEENPADNKPKFQEGDWVVFNPGCNAHQIVRVVENTTSHTYGYDTVDDYYFNDTTEGVRLWNITDAKDGDVLYSLDSKQPFIFKNRKPHQQADVYCGINIFGKFFIENTEECIITADKYVPADKFQREHLFKKMKEAGYEWDSNKKELHKMGEKVKTHRMTNQELADWLRDCTEEHREWKYTSGDIAYSHYCYPESEAFKPVKTILIRRNHGSWQEPLVEY